MMNISAIIKTMRPHQWTKNAFVLAALIFSQHLLDPPYLTRALVAFAAFCLLSSAVYIFNDIKDMDQDRVHPRKRSRPIASGELSAGIAGAVGLGLLFAGLGLSFTLGVPFILVAASYLFLQAGYIYLLKRVVLLDVIIISLGFVIRAIAGAVAISVFISPWLILCTFLIALFLALAKRRHELILLNEAAASHRSNLADYTVPLLDQLISIVTAATIISYSIYTLSPGVTEKFGNRYMILTLPFVLYGIFRYLYLIYVREEGGSPTRVLLADLPLLVSAILWGMTAVGIIYLG